MLPKLKIEGVSFSDGTRPLTVAGFSDFRLLERFSRNEDIGPVLDNRAAVLAEVRAQGVAFGDGGWLVPVLRVFGMYDGGIGRFHPSEVTVADFYTVLRAFCERCAQAGFYVLFETFADAQVVMPSLVDQQVHWWRVCSIDAPNLWRSKGNEYRKNGFDPTRLEGTPNGLWSQGSALSGDDPPQPFGDFTQYHGRRDDLKGYLAPTDLAWATLGYPGFVGTHRATLLDEWLGADERKDPGRRSNDTREFYRAALDAAAWGCGMIFHSTAGVQSEVYGPITQACAMAFAMGLSKVDPVQRFQGVIP